MSVLPDMPPIGAILATRLALRQMCRDGKLCPDQATCDAICKAHSDSNFAGDLAMSAIAANAKCAEVGGGFANILQWLLANAPAIIALIMSLFGKVPVPPTPA